MLPTSGKKVKCILVQALRLCTDCTAHRRSRGIALLFHDHGTRWGEESELHPCRSLPPGKDSVPMVQEAGWAPGPVWTGAKNLAPPGFDPRTVQPVASRYTDWATRTQTSDSYCSMNPSNSTKKPFLYEIRLYANFSVFWCEELTREIFPSISDTPCITQNIMIWVLHCIKALVYCMCRGSGHMLFG
jgi:hypothetical protein